MFLSPTSVLDIENFLCMFPLLICRHSIVLAGANLQRVFHLFCIQKTASSNVLRVPSKFGSACLLSAVSNTTNWQFYSNSHSHRVAHTFSEAISQQFTTCVALGSVERLNNKDVGKDVL